MRLPEWTKKITREENQKAYFEGCDEDLRSLAYKIMGGTPMEEIHDKHPSLPTELIYLLIYPMLTEIVIKAVIEDMSNSSRAVRHIFESFWSDTLIAIVKDSNYLAQKILKLVPDDDDDDDNNGNDPHLPPDLPDGISEMIKEAFSIKFQQNEN